MEIRVLWRRDTMMVACLFTEADQRRCDDACCDPAAEGPHFDRAETYINCAEQR